MREQCLLGIDHQLLRPYRHRQLECCLIPIGEDARHEAQSPVSHAGVDRDSGHQTVWRVLLHKSTSSNRLTGAQTDFRFLQRIGRHSCSAYPTFEKPVQRFVPFKLEFLGEHLFEGLLERASRELLACVARLDVAERGKKESIRCLARAGTLTRNPCYGRALFSSAVTQHLAQHVYEPCSSSVGDVVVALREMRRDQPLPESYRASLATFFPVCILRRQFFAIKSQDGAKFRRMLGF